MPRNRMSSDRRVGEGITPAPTPNGPARSARVNYPAGTLPHLRPEDSSVGDWGLTLFADPRHVRGDVRLVRQAIREGWRCSRRKKKRIMAGMGHLLLASEGNERRSVRLALGLLQTIALAHAKYVDGLLALYKLQRMQERAQAKGQNLERWRD